MEEDTELRMFNSSGELEKKVLCMCEWRVLHQICPDELCHEKTCVLANAEDSKLVNVQVLPSQEIKI